mmetsp:Transcript_11795/g.18514  ORF Transcript_11795/g.18514 Transcript_11795/m.18514 type:complete len:82 (-) Transcript_11795:177-422(-)
MRSSFSPQIYQTLGDNANFCKILGRILCRCGWFIVRTDSEMPGLLIWSSASGQVQLQPLHSLNIKLKKALAARQPLVRRIC